MHTLVDLYVKSIIDATDQVRSIKRPKILAKLANISNELSETSLAHFALEAATNCLPDNIDIDSGDAAKMVAASAALIGKLEIVRLIATAFDDDFSREEVMLDAAKVLTHDPTRRLDVLCLTDEIITSEYDLNHKGRAHLRDRAFDLRVEAGLVDESLPMLDLCVKLSDKSKLRLLLSAGYDIQVEVMLSEKIEQCTVEEAAQLIIELAVRDRVSLARKITLNLLESVNTDSVTEDGGWSHPFFALACKLTGCDRAFNELLNTAEHSRLVTIANKGGCWSIPVTLAVRLGLWKQFHREAEVLPMIVRDWALADLAEALLDYGKTH